MIDNANNCINISLSGNCNFQYLSGLSYGYSPDESGMRKALVHALIQPRRCVKLWPGVA